MPIEQEVKLVATADVESAALLRAIRVEPNARVRTGLSHVWLEGLRASTRYRVRIAGGLRGVGGGVSAPQVIDFETGPPSPQAWLGVQGGQIEPHLMRPVIVEVGRVWSIGAAGPAGCSGASTSTSGASPLGLRSRITSLTSPATTGRGSVLTGA